MSEENFNSEGRAADHLDALINAAQSGIGAPDETGITGFVEWSRSLRPDATYVDDLERHLMALHRVQRHARRRVIRRAVAVAAVIVVLIALLILVRGGDGTTPAGVAPPTGVAMSGITGTAQAPAATVTRIIVTPQLPTHTPPGTPTLTDTPTPVALAATGTLAVEIDMTLVAANYATQNASVQLTAVLMPPTATPSSTATPTALPAVASTPTPLPSATHVPPALDVAFVLDTTQDFEALRTGFVDGLALNGIDVRFGLVGYDATGVAPITDFTRDRTAFAAALADLPPGGESPGALGVALNQALDALSWRGYPTVKVIIVIAGAPDRLGLSAAARRAADQGVTIHVIGVGDLSAADTEILRQIAVISGGQYVPLGTGAALLDQVAALIAESLAGF
jgi:hypothetical protein